MSADKINLILSLSQPQFINNSCSGRINAACSTMRQKKNRKRTSPFRLNALQRNA